MKLLRATMMVLAVFGVMLTQTASAQEVAASDIVLVANADVPGTTLDAATVENIFTGKTSSVGDKKVEITILKAGAVHEAFLKHYIKKTDSQFINSWKKLVFSGKSKMPKDFATEKEMVEYIAKTSGAIGYVHVNTSKDGSIMTDKVKAITIK